MGTIEQARAPRVDFPGETTVYVGNRQVVCAVINLSTSGMLIAEREAPPRATLRPGQFMRLVFSLKASQTQYVDADAIVVREATEHSHQAWGVQFVAVPSHVNTAIGAYVGDRITETAREAGRLARRLPRPTFQGAPRDVTPADLLDASGSHRFGEDETPLRELYREALEQVAVEDAALPPRRR